MGISRCFLLLGEEANDYRLEIIVRCGGGGGVRVGGGWVGVDFLLVGGGGIVGGLEGKWRVYL